MKVLLFAGARDAVGATELELSLSELLPASQTTLTARSLLDAFCARHPSLQPYASSLRVAINGAYAAWDASVSDGDEVAIIPPVAGG